ncbi:hypothetical protein MKW94_004895 [Papaver nudicaule]|uniref:glutathione transferase n=1 Tax=Papaver nudicaule TaxID=74823 RepID=A0AA42AZS6_PAPNU|nr:hypothetical protein [Papaver nudicaule]
MEEDLKLFSVWYSPSGCRVKCALQLKGLEYEYIEEDLSNKSDLLLQYNPVHKKVPVLVHGGKPLAESMIILEYIDETWPDKYPILPRDPHERSKARFWTKYIADKESTFSSLIRATEETKEEKMNEIMEALKNLEELGLGDNKFFAGDDIGFADLAIGTFMRWFRVVEEIKEMKILETCTRLQAWFERFNEVPVVQENLPSIDELVAHYKPHYLASISQ